MDTKSGAIRGKFVTFFMKFSQFSRKIAKMFCRINGKLDSDPKIERLVEFLTIKEKIVKYPENTRYRWIRYCWIPIQVLIILATVGCSLPLESIWTWCVKFKGIFTIITKTNEI